jgi:hypothetical protein
MSILQSFGVAECVLGIEMIEKIAVDAHHIGIYAKTLGLDSDQMQKLA